MGVFEVLGVGFVGPLYADVVCGGKRTPVEGIGCLLQAVSSKQSSKTNTQSDIFRPFFIKLRPRFLVVISGKFQCYVENPGGKLPPGKYEMILFKRRNSGG